MLRLVLLSILPSMIMTKTLSIEHTELLELLAPMLLAGSSAQDTDLGAPW